MEGEVVWVVVEKDVEPEPGMKVLTEVVLDDVAELPPKVPEGVPGLRRKYP